MNDLKTSLSLLARAVKSDSDAWQQLTSNYGPMVYHWCRQSGLAPEDAADVMQNVFRSVASSLNKFRKEKETDRFRAWLRTITKHKIIDFRRTQIDKPNATGGSVALELLHQIPEIAESSTLDESGLTAEMQTVVDNLKSTFNEKTWQAFWRVTVDGITPQLVAEELEMPLDSVYQAKSRVLRKLRAALEN